MNNIDFTINKICLEKLTTIDEISSFISKNTEVVMDEEQILIKKRALSILEKHADNLSLTEYLILKDVIHWCKICEYQKLSSSIIEDNDILSKKYTELFKSEYHKDFVEFVSSLIKTSNLILLFLKGLCSIKECEKLAYIKYSNVNTFKVIRILNCCLISADSENLYERSKNTIDLTINKICNFNLTESFTKLPNSEFSTF